MSETPKDVLETIKGLDGSFYGVLIQVTDKEGEKHIMVVDDYSELENDDPKYGRKDLLIKGWFR